MQELELYIMHTFVLCLRNEALLQALLESQAQIFSPQLDISYKEYLDRVELRRAEILERLAIEARAQHQDLPLDLLEKLGVRTEDKP